MKLFKLKIFGIFIEYHKGKGCKRFCEGKKSHTCSLCGYTCSQKGQLKIHFESVHEGKKPHNCSLCDYACSQKGQLKRLFESVHEEKKPHKCPICNYSKTSWYTINVSQKKSCILKSLILRSIII